MTKVATARAHSLLVQRAATGDAVDRPAVQSLVRYAQPLLGDSAHERTVGAVLDVVEGMGRLEPFLAEHDVSEVMVNGDGRVWIERAGAVAVTEVQLAAAETYALIERAVSPLGLRVDRSSPMVDARLADGSRIHAVVPPLAVDGPCLTIRRFILRDVQLAAFAGDDVAAMLASAVSDGANVVVSGGTGAGKTTLLNALAAHIPRHHRVVTIEETAELRLGVAHVVRLESRPASAEGVGEVSLRDLVRTALRMRPDLIIVGECRGGEALDVLTAMNTGHDGSMTTCHANDAAASLRRMETLCLFANSGLPLEAVRSNIAAAVDLVVHVRRGPSGARFVDHVIEPSVVAGEAPRVLAAGGLTLRERRRRR